MKKLTTALLTALLLLNLAACGEKEPDDTPSGYDDSLISELYSEEGEYTDAENNTLAYSYHVPRIMSETAVAAALNDEIADQFGALVQEQKNMMASRVSLTCLSVTWTSYWNDSLLCLVVRAEMDGDTSMTETYSYDFFGGKRLMSEDLLARCELSTQDFITAARRTAANYFDETYRDALSGSMGGAGFIASYAERRAWTLSDENINAEMRLYLDSGALHMIVPIGSFAGAESYDADLALDLSARETVEKAAQDSFVKAALSGGDLTVSFEKTADSAWYAENFRFDYETIYPVEGLYSDYTDVFVGPGGAGVLPVHLPADERGHGGVREPARGPDGGLPLRRRTARRREGHCFVQVRRGRGGLRHVSDGVRRRRIRGETRPLRRGQRRGLHDPVGISRRVDGDRDARHRRAGQL